MSIEVNTEIKRPSKEILEGFRNLLEEYQEITPGVSDVMNRLNAMSSDIKPLFEGIRLVGVALTVKTMASDLAPVIKALDVIQSEDIIVVDTGNSKNIAFWGEGVTIAARRKGALGVILDSAVRDVVELKKSKFPVICQGVVPNVAGVLGFGYVNFPIQCGGAVVNPGDIVIIDDNGVVVVPLDKAKDILQKTTQFLKNEEWAIAKLEAGTSPSELIGLDKLETAAIDTTVLYEKKRRSGSI